MELLLRGTTAYGVLGGDRTFKRLAHAYLLHFDDTFNLRRALKFFAAQFFGAEEGTQEFAAIMSESFPSMKIYPESGKKIAVDGISEIIADSALKPAFGDKKLYVISGFESAGVLVQNKLLKTLEEPEEGSYFLLGATSLAPVIDTVLSRVRLLEIAPFSERQIFSALERRGENPLNAAAAKSCNGVLGVAENMADGGWFNEISAAAEEICAVDSVGEIGALAAKYGETPYKSELLSEVQRLYFRALKTGTGVAAKHKSPTLIFALERVGKAYNELKFNANFTGLLYDLMLSVTEFDRRGRENL